MNTNSAKLIYFSPTGTTRKVLEGIAQGILSAAVEHVDLTRPEARLLKRVDTRNELAIIGSPVYAGRLPVELIARFQHLKGNGTPAVIVVVYGNRAYEDALVELRNVVAEAGFKPIAAGAFIGEHSYSTEATPIAVGRPDSEDLRKAKEFGAAIHEKLSNLGSLDEAGQLRVPGHFPYKERSGLSGIAPVTQEQVCTKCESCISVCPVGAITMGVSIITDRNVCIRCCACVKACATNARVMDEPRIKQFAAQLSMNCRDRKEREIYI